MSGADRFNGFCRRVLPAVTALGLVMAGCGYRVHPSVGSLPAGVSSLGIPVFQNSSPQFRVEQQITAALLREFSLRTRIPVRPAREGADAILEGEIQTVSASPVAFGSETFGSAFLVTVQASAKLVRARDGHVIWQNSSYLFRERYVLNSRTRDFFSEENPALDRLARDFAASLAGAVLNR